jgi:hypothetical protein
MEHVQMRVRNIEKGEEECAKEQQVLRMRKETLKNMMIEE